MAAGFSTTTLSSRGQYYTVGSLSRTTTSERERWDVVVSYYFESYFWQWNDLWESCNKDRHGHDERTGQDAMKAQFHRKLDLLYAHRNSVLLHRHRTSLDDHEAKPAHVICQWIKTYHPLLKKVQKTETSSNANIRTLSLCFGNCWCIR
jgi:hypothetical protein